MLKCSWLPSSNVLLKLICAINIHWDNEHDCSGVFTSSLGLSSACCRHCQLEFQGPEILYLKLAKWSSSDKKKTKWLLLHDVYSLFVLIMQHLMCCFHLVDRVNNTIRSSNVCLHHRDINSPSIDVQVSFSGPKPNLVFWVMWKTWSNTENLNRNLVICMLNWCFTYCLPQNQIEV